MESEMNISDVNRKQHTININMKPRPLGVRASFWTLALLAATLVTAAPKKPNIVLILADDLGWRDLRCFGSELYQTPNIDSLAAAGMSFRNAYSACTVCSPTRASIMTGRYPAALHLTDWIAGHPRPYAKLKIPDWTMGLSPTNHTLPKALRDAGYTTAHIGKWHLGETEDYWPEHQGFDINIGGCNMGSPKRKAGVTGYFSPYGNPRLPDGPPGEHLPERLSREACAFIDRNKEHPFFLNLCFYSVHTPLQAKPDKIEKYRALADPDARQHNPIYAAMVEHMDDAVGRVLETLKRWGLEDNTIVVFNSDNGGLIGNRGDTNKPPAVTSNYPLRTGKGDAYEGGVRVPLIFRYPGHIKAGTASDMPVISVDYYPTMLDLAGIKTSGRGTTRFDGVSLAGLLRGKKKSLPRDAIYWHYPHYHPEGAAPYGAIRKGEWKLIEFFEDSHVELYKLDDDISERNDLASTRADRVKDLLGDLKSWQKRIGAQMPVTNPDYDPARAGER